MMANTPWNPLICLTDEQREKLAAFQTHLLHLNRRINLISRDTEAAFEERHLLHSLALTHKAFPAGSTVVDWGTGGGLPAIPLAICFPDVAVHAVDAVGKKVEAVQAVGRRLELANLHPWHGRAEDWPGTAVFSVSRAAASLLDLWKWYQRVRSADVVDSDKPQWQPGLICLKGGDLAEEIQALQQAQSGVEVRTTPLQPLLGRPYFAEKVIVEVFDD